MLILRLKLKSQESEDKRTWKEVIKDYGQVRQLLYTTERLMKESARGSVDERPWHVSLVKLSKQRWEPAESEVIIQLILNFLNDDFPAVMKGEEDAKPTIQHT